MSLQEAVAQHPIIAIANVIDPFFSVLTGVFAAYVAYAVARHSRRIARLQALQTIIDSWMRFDTLILTDEDAMAAYNRISGTPPEENVKDDWVIYYYINQAYHAFLAHSYGGVPRRFLDFELDTIWRNILHSKEKVMRTLSEGGYPEEFCKYFISHGSKRAKEKPKD